MITKQLTFFGTIILIIINGFLFGQNTLFFSTYGSSNGDEAMESLIQTSDLGLLIAGGSDSYSSNEDLDVFLLKTDINGNVLWSKTYGGTSDEMAYEVKETEEGGFIVAGWTQSFGAEGYDFWIFKTDENGNLEWEKRFGGSYDDQAWSVAVDNDAYFVVGGTNSFGAGLTDLWAIKLDLSGNILWQRTYGSAGDDAPPGPYTEYAARGIIDHNGNYLISGNTDGVGHGATDIFLAKLNPTNGNIIWQYAYGDTDEESTWNLVESETGGYYLPGNTVNPITYEADLWIVYVDNFGDIQWQKTFGINDAWDEALNATSLADGSIVLASYFEQNDSKWIATSLKVDVNGNFVWSNQYNVGGDLDWMNAALPLNDNTLAFVGVTTDITNWNADIILARTNAFGTVSDCSNIPTFTPVINATNTSQQSIILTVNNTMATPQNTSSVVSNVAIDKNLICSELISNASYDFVKDRIAVYPNPTQENITIDFPTIQNEIIMVVRNQIGKEINRIEWKNTISLNFSITGNPGLYIIEVFDNEGNKNIVKIVKN